MESNPTRPEPVVGLYITYKGRIVMVKGPKWNGWRVPGGHIEYGEDMFDAARREAKEELGINVIPKGLMGVAQAIKPMDFRKQEKHFIFFEILCEAETDKLVLEEREISEYKWVALADAANAFESPISKAVISNYLNSGDADRFIKVL